MGTQLYILASDMEAAGWKSQDVVVYQGCWDTTNADNYGEEPEWVPAVVVREWRHAEYGVLCAYAISSGDFFGNSGSFACVADGRTSNMPALYAFSRPSISNAPLCMYGAVRVTLRSVGVRNRPTSFASFVTSYRPKSCSFRP